MQVFVVTTATIMDRQLDALSSIGVFRTFGEAKAAIERIHNDEQDEQENEARINGDEFERNELEWIDKDQARVDGGFGDCVEYQITEHAFA